MNMFENVLIFSIYQLNNEHNFNNHTEVLNYLKDSGVPCMELVHSVKGETKLSILIGSPNYRNVVERMCREYGQDHYIESFGSDRFVEMVDIPTEKRYGLGYLQNIDKIEAVKLNTYFNDPRTGNFYAITDGS